MKQLIVLVVIVSAFALALALPGCGSGKKSSSGIAGGGGSSGGGGGTGGGGTGGTGGGGNGGGGTGGGGTGTRDPNYVSEDAKKATTPLPCMDFFGGGPWEHPRKDHLCVGSRMEMFEYINIERQTYASHTAYDGYPWKGENSDMTWSTTFTWNDALGEEAQAEAEALAGGGSPKGTRFGYQNFAGEPMWLAGLETSRYMQSAESDPTVEQPQLYEAGKWHSSNNGTMRQGVFYQTGTGANRSKKLLGVGLAEVGNGCVWWVLIFGE